MSALWNAVAKSIVRVGASANDAAQLCELTDRGLPRDLPVGTVESGPISVVLSIVVAPVTVNVPVTASNFTPRMEQLAVQNVGIRWEAPKNDPF